MIDSKQTGVLLNQCETWLGTGLGKLRQTLQNQEKPKPVLWELIVLHTFSALLNIQIDDSDTCNAISSIQHEPDEGNPDVFVHLNECKSLYIDATFIETRKEQEQELHYFCYWVREKLKDQNFPDAQALRISVKPANPAQDIQVPANNLWKKQLQTDSWKRFFAEILSGKFPCSWLIEDSKNGSNVLVYVECPAAGLLPAYSLPVQNIPTCATDNPIYRTLVRKAKQAKQWEDAGNCFQPLVIVIGASDSLHQIQGHDSSSTRNMEKAIYSALADIRNISKSHASRISAVIVVTIKNQYSGFNGKLEPRASTLFVKNPHADFPLSSLHEEILGKIDFNQVKYSLGYEHWEQQPQYHPKPLISKYFLESQGNFVWSYGLNSSFNVEIPLDIIAPVLSGDLLAEELWMVDLENEIPYPPSHKEISDLLRAAANIRQPVINIKFVCGDPVNREGARLRLEFGTFAMSAKNKKDHIESIDDLNNGGFRLILSASCLVELLAGGKTSAEHLKYEIPQDLREAIKSAVGQGQAIINAEFIPSDLELGYSPQIALTFEAKQEKLIREARRQSRKHK
jgi:hypothetical protein